MIFFSPSPLCCGMGWGGWSATSAQVLTSREKSVSFPQIAQVRSGMFSARQRAGTRNNAKLGSVRPFSFTKKKKAQFHFIPLCNQQIIFQIENEVAFVCEWIVQEVPIHQH